MDALPALVSKKNIDLMEKYNVLSPREMESRCEIYLERYVKDVAVESRLTLEIAKTTIFPAAIKYQHQLASTALALKQLDKDALHHRARRGERTWLRNWRSPFRLWKRRSGIMSEGSTLDHAKYARDHIVPAMARVREVADQLECVVSDEFWPLPTYQEMLFIK